MSEILSFLSLPEGWHFGRGKPAELARTINALRVVGVLKELGFTRFEAFPDVDGSVLISSFFGDDSIEILCRSDNRYSFGIERNDQEDETGEDVDEDTILTIIWGMSCRNLVRSSDYFTPGITVSRKEDSRASHLRTTTAVYQSSTLYALPPTVVAYAPIYQYTIHNYPEILQYSGEYLYTNSRQALNLSLRDPQAETTVIMWPSEFPTQPTKPGSEAKV